MTSKLLPLSGAAAVVLIVASFAAAGSVPKQDAPTSELVSFYADHDTGQLVSASVLSLGALLFLVFVASSARHFGTGREPVARPGPSASVAGSCSWSDSRSSRD